MLKNSRKSKNKNFFLLAPAYHGATLLSLVLGNHTQIISLGDTLPTNDFDQVCGCGSKVSQCEFWQNIKNTIPCEPSNKLLPEYYSLIGNKSINKVAVYLLLLLANKVGLKFHNNSFLRTYTAFLEYVLRYYNKDIFIDGCKSINRYLSVKASNNSIGGVLYLVRDPRAFALSAKKGLGISVDEAANIYNSFHSRVLMTLNFLKEKYLMVTYEEFIEKPDDVLGGILEFMNVDNENILLPINKNVHWMGNSSLFNFDGNLYENQKWKEQLNPDEQNLVMFKTAKVCTKLALYG